MQNKLLKYRQEKMIPNKKVKRKTIILVKKIFSNQNLKRMNSMMKEIILINKIKRNRQAEDLVLLSVK